VAGAPRKPSALLSSRRDGEPQAWSNGTGYVTWFMTLSDGAVVDGTAFHDSTSFNELWEEVSLEELACAWARSRVTNADRGLRLCG
jgi:hypothetical protein